MRRAVGGRWGRWAVFKEERRPGRARLQRRRRGCGRRRRRGAVEDRRRERRRPAALDPRGPRAPRAVLPEGVLLRGAALEAVLHGGPRRLLALLLHDPLCAVLLAEQRELGLEAGRRRLRLLALGAPARAGPRAVRPRSRQQRRRPRLRRPRPACGGHGGGGVGPRPWPSGWQRWRVPWDGRSDRRTDARLRVELDTVEARARGAHVDSALRRSCSAPSVRSGMGSVAAEGSRRRCCWIRG